MSDTSDSTQGPIKAPLNGRWLLKMSIFTIVMIAVGGWGLYDAAIAYPDRGERVASWAQWQYLQAVKEADDREDFGVMVRDASVPDPKAEYASITDPEVSARLNRDASDRSGPRYYRANMRLARKFWLDQLKKIGQMKPDRTTMENPAQELNTLRAEWATAAQPKPLSSFDLKTQWLIMGVSWAVAAYLIALFVRVGTTRFRWHEAEGRLDLPGGHSITASDLTEVDKRKWDKFIVFLKINDSHKSLGGREIRLDTYRHSKLEDWVLTMEATAFGTEEDSAKPKADAAGAAESSSEPKGE